MAIYFDNSATTQPFPQVADTVYRYMQDEFYNPSALYAPAVHAFQKLTRTRELVANDMGVQPNTIYFNSGGTEGNNDIIKGIMLARPSGAHAITNIGEHSSVLETYKQLKQMGYDMEAVGLDGNGRVQQEEIMRVLRPDTALISLMHVSNETGAVNDIEAIAHAVKQVSPNCVIHVDGVQAYPKFKRPKGVDAYNISGHKFNAPRGVGAMYIADSVVIESLITGGGQERGMRAGTENCAGIMGLDVALRVYIENRQNIVQNMGAVKKRLYENLTTIDGMRVNGPDIDSGAPHILNVAFSGINAETLVHALEAKDIYVGTGSACSSKKNSRNRVLVALGVPEEYINGAIRFSLGHANTLFEADVVAQEVADAVKKARRFKRR